MRVERQTLCPCGCGWLGSCILCAMDRATKEREDDAERRLRVAVAISIRSREQADSRAGWKKLK